MKLISPLLILSFLSGCSEEIDFETYQPDQGVTLQVRETSSWDSYAGEGSTRSSGLNQINKDNVENLGISWTFRTGDVSTVFQSTPIISNGALVLCTPHNQVIALDPLFDRV